MRVLITGMSGFAGQHLADLLLRETHWTVIGASRNTQGDRAHQRLFWWQVDLKDADAIKRMLTYERPDVIVHMAAQAHVPTSWQNARGTYEDNVLGQLNLFEGVIATKLTPRMLVISSNEVYGRPSSPAVLPYREDHPMRPNNPYAVSKCTQDLMALQYHISHNYDVLVARPFNHIGPSQAARFVAADFARQIAEIELGRREPVLALGNMSAERDFTDVRDVARAYLALIQGGEAGEIYNVCSGRPRSIQYLLDVLLSMSSANIEQRSDPAKFRPADTPISFGDASKLRAATGWAPKIPFEQTLQDILNDWRTKCKETLTGNTAA